MTEKIVKTRRHDLDWLRVGAILLLLFYHVGMIFVTWGFHIKNEQQSELLEIPMFMLSSWRMPLLFFISGLGTMFALGSRKTRGYCLERSRRLLIPLIFGMFVIVPPQIYVEHLFKGVEYASYAQFYPEVLEFIPYPEGSFSWHHLWFIIYLFVYSLIGLPFFLFIRASRDKAWWAKLDAFMSKPGMLFLLAIPIAIAQITLREAWPTDQNLIADWANFTYHLCLFLSGFLVGSLKTAWHSIRQQRRLYMVVAVSLILILTARNNDFIFHIEYTLYWALKSVATLSCVLALCGYAHQYLNFNNRFLKYANEGIYPFYILHQTVELVIGYRVIQWDMGITGKFLIITAATFVISMLIYEFLIRRWNPVRPFFGLKPKRAAEEPELLGERGSKPLDANGVAA